MRHAVVTREQWIKQRQAPLLEDKKITKRRDQLSQKRRALPWLKIEKTYVFDTPRGRHSPISPAIAASFR